MRRKNARSAGTSVSSFGPGSFLVKEAPPACFATAPLPEECRFCLSAEIVSRRCGAPSLHEGAVQQVLEEEAGVQAWRRGLRHEDADDLLLRVDGEARATEA
jgi:hypothetical protein